MPHYKRVAQGLALIFQPAQWIPLGLSYLHSPLIWNHFDPFSLPLTSPSSLLPTMQVLQWSNTPTLSSNLLVMHFISICHLQIHHPPIQACLHLHLLHVPMLQHPVNHRTELETSWLGSSNTNLRFSMC